MRWFGKNQTRRGALPTVMAWLVATAWMGMAAEDPDADRWFNRHDETLWRGLAQQWESVKAAMRSPVENLNLPLEVHENGRIKATLHAVKAQIFPDGLIFAEGVQVRLLTAEGAPDGLLTAEGCLFDRNARHGYCKGAVRVVKDGDRLKGRGMYFSIERQFIKILADCEIRTHRMRNNFGRIK